MLRVARGTRTAVSVASCARTPVPSGPRRLAKILERRIAATRPAADPRPRIAVDRTSRRMRGLASPGLPSPVHALVVLTELAGADRFPPGAVLHVPVDGLGDPAREVDARPEPRLSRELRGVDGVAAVVSRPVGDALEHRGRLSEPLEDQGSDLEHRALVPAGDVEGLSFDVVGFEERDQRAAVVLDVDPVA